MVVQYFTSTEILLDCVILAVPMTLIFLARHFRDGPRVPKRLLIALSCACLVALPLLAYPLWVTLAGPYHVLLNPAKASGITLSNPAWPSANSPSAAGFVIPPGSGFVGAGAIVVAPAALFWWRQAREVAHCAAGALIAFVLALGLNIRTAGSVLLRTSPIAWFAHVPLVRAITPYRFSGLMVMFIALLCATTITQVSRRLAQLGPSRHVAVARWSTPALLAAAVLVLPLLADRFPSGVEHVELPAAVSAAVTPGDRNATLDVYPGVGVFSGDPLIWQALSSMSLRLTDGYAFIREPNGTIGFTPPPTITNILFAAAQLGMLRPGLTRPRERQSPTIFGGHRSPVSCCWSTAFTLAGLIRTSGRCSARRRSSPPRSTRGTTWRSRLRHQVSRVAEEHRGHTLGCTQEFASC